jgi:hypothetical protein
MEWYASKGSRDCGARGSRELARGSMELAKESRE